MDPNFKIDDIDDSFVEKEGREVNRGDSQFKQLEVNVNGSMPVVNIPRHKLDIKKNDQVVKSFLANYVLHTQNSKLLTQRQREIAEEQLGNKKFQNNYVKVPLNAPAEYVATAAELGLGVEIHNNDPTLTLNHEMIRFTQIACWNKMQSKITAEAEKLVNKLKKLGKNTPEVLEVIEKPIIELFAHPKYGTDPNMTYKVYGRIAAKDVFRVDSQLLTFLNSKLAQTDLVTQIARYKDEVEQLGGSLNTEHLAFLDQNSFLISDLEQLNVIKDKIKHRIVVMVDGLYYNRKSILQLMTTGQKLFACYFCARRLNAFQTAYGKFKESSNDILVRENALIYYRIGNGDAKELPEFGDSMNMVCNKPKCLTDHIENPTDKQKALDQYAKDYHDYHKYEMPMFFLGGDVYKATLIPELEGITSFKIEKNNFVATSITKNFNIDFGYACTEFECTERYYETVVNEFKPVYKTHYELLKPKAMQLARDYLRNTREITAQLNAKSLIKRNPETSVLSNSEIGTIIDEVVEELHTEVIDRTRKLKELNMKAYLVRLMENTAYMWIPLTIMLIAIMWIKADLMVSLFVFGCICYVVNEFEICPSFMAPKKIKTWAENAEYGKVTSLYLVWVVILMLRLYVVGYTAPDGIISTEGFKR